MSDARYLLVTTTRAAWVLDTQSGRARLLDEGRGVYYGITFSEDEIFIACRQVDVGADRETQRNLVLCFDTALRPTRALRSPFPIRDVHQICYHAGTLFICSTFDDAVVRYDLTKRSWDVWHPFGAGIGLDQHHINSVTVGSGGLLLAGNRPTGWAARFSPDLAPAGDRVWIGSGTHNVWADAEQLAVCSSEEGAIRRERGDDETIMSRGWLRGYAQGPERRYVGVSQNMVRSIRERSDCMILALAPAGAVEAIYGFRGFGMLHDLRIAGAADASHNGLTLTLSDRDVTTLRVAYQTARDPIPLAATGDMLTKCEPSGRRT